MYVIDDELKDFIESGVAAVIGTADASGRPCGTFCWGLRVGEHRSQMTLFVETARAAEALANLNATGLIAMTAASPVSYRSVQLKGRWLGRSEATETDKAWVQRHRDAFLTETSLVGDPPAVARNHWMDCPVVRIDFTVEQAFDQTPGPNAGHAL